MSDQIRLNGLRLVSTVGVPDEERSRPQTVAVNVIIDLATSVQGIGDRLEHTLDYYAVSEELREVASSGERRLIETLAEDLAAAVLKFEGVCSVTLEVEKYILADCDSVSVVVFRERGEK